MIPRPVQTDNRSGGNGMTTTATWSDGISDQAAQRELKLAADRMALDESHGRFRAKPAPTESPRTRQMVALAVARAKEGDREAVRFLYLSYSGNVYAYVRAIVRADHDAEDITQHVFAKLITVIHRYQQRTAPFLAWLLRLAHNAAIDHLRVKTPTPCAEVIDANERDDYDSSERSGSLRTAMEALPEDQRNVLMLRHVAGLTPPEIAVRIGRTESSVHGLHHRGRRSLQQELLRLGAGPVTGRRPARRRAEVAA